MMSIIYEDCIGIWYVKPRFYNRGCKQYIIITLNKIVHDIFNMCAIHLAMYNGSFNIRAYPAALSLYQFNILNPVMNKKDLSVPGNFIFNALFYYLFIKAMKFSNNRHPVGWGSVNY